jgi:N-acetylglucosamine malate deacetylase 1
VLDRLFRAIHRRLSPQARNALRTWLVLEERDRIPEPITRFDEARVLVLAPHSDDEVLGCGGVIARHVASGAVLDVVYLTDGCWGDGKLFDPALQAPQKAALQTELVLTRQREAREASRILGGHALHFLNRPDSRLLPDTSTVQALRDTLMALQPQMVYLPFVYDLHEDHWQTNRAFAAAAADLPPELQRGMQVRGYEVWTPLLANRVADISDVMPLKLRALARFKSQLQDQDYGHIISGLNAFRSNGVFGGQGYAEAFHELPLAAYLRLVRAAALRGSPLPRNVGVNLTKGRAVKVPLEAGA